MRRFYLSICTALFPFWFFPDTVLGQDKIPLVKFEGRAQGTTYHVSYYSADSVSFQWAIDSILHNIDSSLSTYLPGSIISRINKNDNKVKADVHFKKVYERAMQISQLTDGLFDITVGPFVDAWGFGAGKKKDIKTVHADSLLRFVGYKKVTLKEDKVMKQYPEMMIDMNAIAQGYTVDVIAAYLEHNAISRYIVELGGEVKTCGKKADDEFWKIGVDYPSEMESNEYEAIIGLENKSLATSGNYRRYYEEDGKKYAHIIDPRTGYPAKHNLLSATVVTDECMDADAFATAFMVMGVNQTMDFISQHHEEKLEVILIFDDNGVWKTYVSPTLRSSIIYLKKTGN